MQRFETAATAVTPTRSDSFTEVPQSAETSTSTRDSDIQDLIDKVEDHEYPIDHPQVLRLTRFFLKRKDEARLFDRVSQRSQPRTSRQAAPVGVAWHAFSKQVPIFLCNAAAKLTRPQMRHSLIQTLYEENGCGRPDKIHSDLFFDAVREIGIGEEEFMTWGADPGFPETLAFLMQVLQRANSDTEVLGLCHGLEIPAEQIIERLFIGLAFSPEAKESLSTSLFFRIHRVVEEEHVRRGTATFLRFCPTLADRISFLVGFDKGLVFWKQFFDHLAAALHKASLAA